LALDKETWTSPTVFVSLGYALNLLRSSFKTTENIFMAMGWQFFYYSLKFQYQTVQNNCSRKSCSCLMKHKTAADKEALAGLKSLIYITTLQISEDSCKMVFIVY
jgi:hypothetical protein